MKTFVPDHHDENVPLRRCSSPFLPKSKVINTSIIIIMTAAAFLMLIILDSPYSRALRFERIPPRPPPYKITDESYYEYNTSDYKKRFPQALIIGARKGGTRALLNFLNNHHDIVTARKEVHFFDQHFDKGRQWYLNKMPESYPGQITMEKSPHYLVDEHTPYRIHQYFPAIKLIVTMRDPVNRAMSDYLQAKYNKKYPEFVYTFENLVIDQTTGRINQSYIIIQRSLYTLYIQRWLKYFKMSQILVLDGDNLTRRPWEELYKVEEFLGVDHELQQSRFVFNSTKGFFCFMTTQPNSQGQLKQECMGREKGRPHPRVDKEVKEKLQEFFRPYNEKLFKQIGRRFSWF